MLCASVRGLWPSWQRSLGIYQGATSYYSPPRGWRLTRHLVSNEDVLLHRLASHVNVSSMASPGVTGLWSSTTYQSAVC